MGFQHGELNSLPPKAQNGWLRRLDHGPERLTYLQGWPGMRSVAG